MALFLPAQLEGQVFGMLTVKENAGPCKEGHCWLCVCECGGQRLAPTKKLKAGRILHCGCVPKRNGPLPGFVRKKVAVSKEAADLLTRAFA